MVEKESFPLEKLVSPQPEVQEVIRKVRSLVDFFYDAPI